MKNYSPNMILPLTLKQLKKAQQQYRVRKNKTYDSASYEFVSVVARVTKVSAMQIQLCDQTAILQCQLFTTAMKKAADPGVGKYYRFSFSPKRNILNGSDGFGFQVVGTMRVVSNQITIHLINCLKEKVDRERFKQQVDAKDPSHNPTTTTNPSTISPNNSGKLSNSSSVLVRTSNNESEISQFCRSLKKEFDVDAIVGHFGGKYTVREIENVLEVLSEKGLVMDLGMVYEWVGEEEGEEGQQE